MVHVNGDLTTCCLDEGMVNRLGNVLETPLAELWNGPLLHRWRVAQAEGRFAESGPYCNRCNWQSAGALSDVDVEEYLEKKAELPALRRYRERRG
jgi:MoaA/NifB/PqqE/SkfB family radical SAM enzyme